MNGEKNGIGIMMHELTFNELPSSDIMLSATRPVFESPMCDECVWRQRSPRPLSRNRGRVLTPSSKGKEGERRGKGMGSGEEGKVG